MIVLDTHVWLWLFAAPEQLSKRARIAVEEADRLGISAMTCWEVAVLDRLGRIELDAAADVWVGEALAQDRTEALPVTTEIAVAAGVLPASFSGDPADRVIYATAREHGAPLVTKDRQMRAFDSAGTIW